MAQHEVGERENPTAFDVETNLFEILDRWQFAKTDSFEVGIEGIRVIRNTEQEINHTIPSCFISRAANLFRKKRIHATILESTPLPIAGRGSRRMIRTLQPDQAHSRAPREAGRQGVPARGHAGVRDFPSDRLEAGARDCGVGAGY
jgi:hypothetical protein